MIETYLLFLAFGVCAILFVHRIAKGESDKWNVYQKATTALNVSVLKLKNTTKSMAQITATASTQLSSGSEKSNLKGKDENA